MGEYLLYQGSESLPSGQNVLYSGILLQYRNILIDKRLWIERPQCSRNPNSKHICQDVRHCLWKHAHIFCFILCFCASRPGSAKYKGPGNLFIFPLPVAPDESTHVNFAELFHQFLKFLQKRVADQETGSGNCSAIKMIFWSVSAAAYLEQESRGSCSSQIEPQASNIISPALITIKNCPFPPTCLQAFWLMNLFT